MKQFRRVDNVAKQSPESFRLKLYITGYDSFGTIPSLSICYTIRRIIPTLYTSIADDKLKLRIFLVQ